MHVVAHAGAVRGRVVVAVDPRGLPLEQRLDDEREEVVRAAVVDLVGARADDVEVAQRRVAEAGGAALVARSATPRSSFVSPYGDSGRVGVSSVTSAVSGVPYVAALDEKTSARPRRPPWHAAGRRSPGRSARRCAAAGHRDAGVLEPGEVDDPGDRVLLERAPDRAGVEDARLDQGDVGGDELAVAAGEVVERDHLDAGAAEGADDVGSDVAGAAGDEDLHAR